MAKMLLTEMIDDPLSTDAEPSSHPSYAQPRNRGGRCTPAHTR
jgi:hypothetical protein